MFPSFIKAIAVGSILTATAFAQTSDYVPPIVQPLPATPSDSDLPGATAPQDAIKPVAPNQQTVGSDYFKQQCDSCEHQTQSQRGRKYYNIFGGASLLDQVNGVNQTPEPFTMDFNEGFLLGISTGRYFNNCSRFEVEGVWRNNTVDTLSINNVGTPFAGRVNNYSSMLNVYREFGRGALRPYIGGGIGLAFNRGDFLINGAAAQVDDYEFAYQAIAGLNFWQTQNREFFAEYRYFATTDSDLTDGAGVLISDDFRYRNHNLIFGIRFKF